MRPSVLALAALHPSVCSLLLAQSLAELEEGVEYSTSRYNTIVRQSSHQYSLRGPDGAEPVTIDTSANGTEHGVAPALETGVGRPPQDPTAAYRVRISVATPQVTNAAKRAGHGSAEAELVVQVHPAWAPLAAAQFQQIVQQQVLVGSRFYCVVPGFVAQFGLPADPGLGLRWRQLPIADDPPKEKNTAGRLAFVSHGANSRSVELFINLGDNSQPGATRRPSAHRLI